MEPRRQGTPSADDAALAAAEPAKKKRKRKPPVYGKATLNTPAEARLAYSIPEALGTGAVSSRNKLYGAIARGELRTYTDGKRRLISADALREFIARRERAAAEGEPLKPVQALEKAKKRKRELAQQDAPTSEERPA